MITCREDLIKFLRKNTSKHEWRDSGTLLCKGVEVNGNLLLSVATCWSEADNCCFVRIVRNDQSVDIVNFNDIFEPRTKEAYEKVDCSIWSLEEEYSRGDLFFELDGEYKPVTSVICLGTALNNGLCYRKVTKPIEWWEDACECVNENACNINPVARNLEDGGLYIEAKMTRDQWCDFARILLEQGE